MVLLRPLVMLIGFQVYDICSVLLNNFCLLNCQWCNNTVLLYGAADEMHIDLQADSVHTSICREAIMPKIRHPSPLFSTVSNNGVSACLCLPSGSMFSSLIPPPASTRIHLVRDYTTIFHIFRIWDTYHYIVLCIAFTNQEYNMSFPLTLFHLNHPGLAEIFAPDGVSGSDIMENFRQ